MKEFVDSLTGRFIKDSKNPYARFIIKKNIYDTNINAYKKYRVELYLHIPNRNIKCFDVEVTAKQEDINDAVRKVFWDRIIEFLTEGDYGNLCRETSME